MATQGQIGSYPVLGFGWRRLASVLLPLLAVGCLESNPQPSPAVEDTCVGSRIEDTGGAGAPDLPEFMDSKAANHGDFVIHGLSPCADATLVLEAPGFTTTQTETFFTGQQGISEIAVQVPSVDIFDMLAGILGGIGGAEFCQVASTISVAEMSLTNYLVPHGVDGATATICPWPGSDTGPIFFAYISDALILPDPGRTDSSVDGGVIFRDLPPGVYTMRAHKEGTSFREVQVTCLPGGFVNAGPPKGLHALD